LALAKIDAVIKTVKQSKDKDVAKINLIKKFKLSERQAVAILEMKLQQLANLERLKIDQELKEKLALIKELEEILSSPKKILEIIKKETKEIAEKYGEDRRTKIVVGGVKEFSMEDLVPNEPTIIMSTHDGYIKRMPIDTFKTQARGGKGVVGLTTKEEDEIEHLVTASTHDQILFFTNKGRVFGTKAYEIPESSRQAKGQALVNFLNLEQGEEIKSILPMSLSSVVLISVMQYNLGLTLPALLSLPILVKFIIESWFIIKMYRHGV